MQINIVHKLSIFTFIVLISTPLFATCETDAHEIYWHARGYDFYIQRYWIVKIDNINKIVTHEQTCQAYLTSLRVDGDIVWTLGDWRNTLRIYNVDAD